MLVYLWKYNFQTQDQTQIHFSVIQSEELKGLNSISALFHNVLPHNLMLVLHSYALQAPLQVKHVVIIGLLEHINVCGLDCWDDNNTFFRTGPYIKQKASLVD